MPLLAVSRADERAEDDGVRMPSESIALIWFCRIVSVSCSSVSRCSALRWDTRWLMRSSSSRCTTSWYAALTRLSSSMRAECSFASALYCSRRTASLARIAAVSASLSRTACWCDCMSTCTTLSCSSICCSSRSNSPMAACCASSCRRCSLRMLRSSASRAACIDTSCRSCARSRSCVSASVVWTSCTCACAPATASRAFACACSCAAVACCSAAWARASSCWCSRRSVSSTRSRSCCCCASCSRVASWSRWARSSARSAVLSACRCTAVSVASRCASSRVACSDPSAVRSAPATASRSACRR
eukprot:Unigene12633_Nuclearia_a/m.38381 Unigene12633_Nuclearia_a/g.38381  ORF Unigene12633_Nuclearia_a/g.38381 Unigene12633_Nuclearia_a/m.38381 type:complete len:303 (-) Unigene12633_Nuclearia_a:1487-2395(-)